MGSPTPTLEMPVRTPATPAVVVSTPAIKVWTASRTAPIVGIAAVAIAEVALQPDVTGSLIAIAVEIVLMSVLVKTWMSH